MPYLANQKQKSIELLAKVSEAATGKKADLGMTGTMHNIEDIDKGPKKTTVPK